MWHHFVNLFRHSWYNFTESLGSTTLGVLFPIILWIVSFAAFALYVLWKEGVTEMRTHIKETLGCATIISFLSTLSVMGLFVGYNATHIIYEDHNSFVAENKSLKSQLQTLALPTLLDKIPGAITASDRERLANALYDFSQILDRGNKLWGDANLAAASLNHSWQGSMEKDADTYINQFNQLLVDSKSYEKSFGKRQKWKYYQNQIDFIFGNNPDNNAALMQNAISEYLYFLTNWQKVQNKGDRQAQLLFEPEQNRFEPAIRNYQPET